MKKIFATLFLLAACAAALCAAPRPGDVAVFGSYPSEGEKTPLEWIVLTAGSPGGEGLPFYTLICRYVPESCSREELGEEWETSLLRLRLNTEFLEKCFSPEEQEKLLEWSYTEEPTADKVTLLQGFGDLWVDDGLSVWGFFDGAETRKAEPAPFADMKTENGCCPWALRKIPGSAFTYVDSLGVPREAGGVEKQGVRPVIRVKKDTPLKVTGHINAPKFPLSREVKKYEKGMPLAKGDRLLFGSAEQDGNAKNGKEPIEWIVLEVKDEKALAVSKDILYYLEPDYKTWEKGSLREYLNGKFFRFAFSESEKALVQEADIATRDVAAERKAFSTRDKCFALSAAELTALFPSAEARKCRSSKTAATVASGGDELHIYARDCFITRDNGFADEDGVIEFPHEGGITYGVRPALWLSR